jgi:RNA polymerase sigma-70 factor, ECF subfamily
VTETYDCSQAPQPEQAAMNGGRIWIKSMAETLQRLDALCAAKAR